jgi:hypothetical protein
MKRVSVLSIVSSLCLASAALASDSHHFDRGMESSLRAAIHDRHVHIHVRRGIVTVDGRVQTEADRVRIDEMIRHTPGVVAVKDDLHVVLPSPGAVVSVPTRVPVYATAAPVLVPSAPVVISPAPLLIPEYPRVSVQAWSGEDQSTAVRISRQLQGTGMPVTVIDNVTVNVQSGNVSLKGAVETEADHRALLSAVERAGGVRAIYDQLRVRSM